MPQSKNLITKDHIKSKIDYVRYITAPGSTLTICIIKLYNGYEVSGESACVDPANFDRAKGEKIAYEKAFNSIYPLEGYLLAEGLHKQPKPSSSGLSGRGYGVLITVPVSLGSEGLDSMLERIGPVKAQLDEASKAGHLLGWERDKVKNFLTIILSEQGFPAPVEFTLTPREGGRTLLKWECELGATYETNLDVPESVKPERPYSAGATEVADGELGDILSDEEDKPAKGADVDTLLPVLEKTWCAVHYVEARPAPEYLADDMSTLCRLTHASIARKPELVEQPRATRLKLNRWLTDLNLPEARIPAKGVAASTFVHIDEYNNVVATAMEEATHIKLSWYTEAGDRYAILPKLPQNI